MDVGASKLLIRQGTCWSRVTTFFDRLHAESAPARAAEAEMVRWQLELGLLKSGQNDPAKPIATLLFAGPTGVGKTAAAKALASYFYGADSGVDPLFRVDMSEFQHEFQIARLIGTGRRPGKLVEHVRQRPFSVVLLDEIEKADASAFDLLLGVLDEGRLRDSQAPRPATRALPPATPATEASN